ncbi:MAG: ABC transporter permease subunit [Treponema sp.]|jgi:putative aldouronate transport system permease protein|nr:ABC transporter permease subunit [Treponema sp.]
MVEKAATAKSEVKSINQSSYFRRSWMLYAMLAFPMIFFIIFRYIPMTNIVIAFKDYNIFQGVWSEGSPWVGFKWFQRAFASRDFWNAMRNTIWLNFLDLVLGFPAPIILALLLNEVVFKSFKKLTQTIIYLPHFLSWIIVSSIASRLLAPTSGVVNIFLVNNFGIGPIDFLMDKGKWVMTYIFFGIWKEMGWGTIIYLAAITGINPELYEAAEVDGAGRWRKLWNITLPGLKPTIVILLIMNIGRILGIELDRPYTMMNNIVIEVADVLSTLVYRVGIRSFQFSLTAAIGLFQSVICVIFLVSANALAKKFGERGIW